jgi:hypothetical protein
VAHSKHGEPTSVSANSHPCRYNNVWCDGWRADDGGRA